MVRAGVRRPSGLRLVLLLLLAAAAPLRALRLHRVCPPGEAPRPGQRARFLVELGEGAAAAVPVFVARLDSGALVVALDRVMPLALGGSLSSDEACVWDSLLGTAQCRRTGTKWTLQDGSVRGPWLPPPPGLPGGLATRVLRAGTPAERRGLVVFEHREVEAAAEAAEEGAAGSAEAGVFIGEEALRGAQRLLELPAPRRLRLASRVLARRPAVPVPHEAVGLSVRVRGDRAPRLTAAQRLGLVRCPEEVNAELTVVAAAEGRGGRSSEAGRMNLRLPYALATRGSGGRAFEATRPPASVGSCRAASASSGAGGDVRGVAVMVSMFVDPAFRGQSLGRRLLLAACDALLEKGFSHMLIVVMDAGSGRLRAYYRRLGFIAIDAEMRAALRLGAEDAMVADLAALREACAAAA